MATRRKRTGNGGPVRTGRRKNVDASMKLLFMDRRMVEAFFLAVCGRAVGIAFETLRQLSGEIPSAGPEGTRRIDLLWKGRMLGGAPFRLILEIQGQWDRSIVRRMSEHCSLPLIGRFRGALHGSLPFVIPVVLYCGPRRRKTGAPSLLDSFVDVPRACQQDGRGSSTATMGMRSATERAKMQSAAANIRRPDAVSARPRNAIPSQPPRHDDPGSLPDTGGEPQLPRPRRHASGRRRSLFVTDSERLLDGQ